MAKGQLSSKKPENLPVKKPVLEYNNKSYQSFLDNGLDVPRNVGKKERVFVARVSDKYPIRRNVVTMIRERILDSQTNKMREVLTWTEDWFGQNWVGLKLAPVRGHVEGVWIKQTLEPVLDEESHEVSGYKSGDPETIYDYDFDKNTVDAILKKSGTPDHDLVKFIVKGPGGRRGYASYDQFVGYSWDECNDILFTSGGFEGARIKEKQKQVIETADKTK
jgi:hypothetical protein